MALFVVGGFLVAVGPDLYTALAGAVNASAEPGMRVLSVVLTIVRTGLIPLGAALFGAAVVIQALSGEHPPRE
ncbi:hypothetical protein [Georgenia deserti]|uniref:Uncharacterized protein n=1 Tax=Georgenia deserti TaxID=2093781 RepID=A0ABW4L9P1_9MICO